MQRHRPPQEAEAVGGDFDVAVEARQRAEREHGDRPGDGPPVGGVLLRVGQEAEERRSEHAEEERAKAELRAKIDSSDEPHVAQAIIG